MTGSTSAIARKAPVVRGHVAPAEENLPFARHRALDLLLARHPRRRSFGRNTMPTPYWPMAGSEALRSACLAQETVNSWIRMAPSPCSGSAPVAPRWDRFRRIDNACVMIAWRFWPLMWAMKPRPHASRSCAGSYRPCRDGGQHGDPSEVSCTMTSPDRRGIPAGFVAPAGGLPESGRNLCRLAAMLQCDKAPGIARGGARNSFRLAGNWLAKTLAPGPILGFNLKRMG